MTWFKVDDHLHDHRKADRAGTHAMGMWVLAGSWCSANLTDGFIPDRVWKRYGPVSLAKRLVASGLWSSATQDGETGYQFHDWTQANPTKVKVLAERQAATERQAKRRESQRDIHRDSQGESHDPDPTRPDPTEEQPPPTTSVSPLVKPKRGCRLPDDWRPDNALRDWTLTEGGLTQEQAGHELAKFRDYWHAKTGRDATKADWAGVWRNWVRRVTERTSPAARTTTSTTDERVKAALSLMEGTR